MMHKPLLFLQTFELEPATPLTSSRSTSETIWELTYAILRQYEKTQVKFERKYLEFYITLEKTVFISSSEKRASVNTDY